VSDFEDRAKRPGGTPSSGRRPAAGRPTGGGPVRKPRRDGQPPQRDGDYKPRRTADGTPPRSTDGRPRRGDDAPRRDGSERPRRGSDVRPARDGERRPPHSIRPDDRGVRPPRDDDRELPDTRSVRNRHDDPVLPDDVQPKDLDRVARAQLKTLAKENADDVARHLAMVARLIDTDPALAHEHALSAARRAGRIAVVRETLAITAYSVGDYALALRELRTYRRISGRDDQLPLMVDSERGLGRPDRALELGRSVPRASLPVEVQVLLAIAMSGARLDLGQPDAALSELQIPQLDPSRAFSWSPALFDAYATVLEELDRQAEAEEWFARSDAAAEALGASGDDDELIEVFEEVPEDEAPENA